MTTQSQQQQMAQPGDARTDQTNGAASTQATAGTTAGITDGQNESGFWGGACGAGAGAAILWRPISVVGSGRR